MGRRACLVLVLCACAPAGGEGPRPNVLLVTIDTLRADHLSCYGYARATSPHLDALAAECLLFEDASTPRAKTTPAMASLLTGLYPHSHGVRDLTAPLGSGPRLLQEVLGERGYATGAIVGNYVLTNARAGLARGFDTWIEELPEVRGVPPDAVPERTARSLTDAALAALDDPAFGRGPAPFFLWLHYMDPHGAYAAPDEHRVFEPGPARWVPREDELEPSALHRLRVADYNVPAGARVDGRVDAARAIAEYDAEIRYVDAELGRLWEHLRAGGLLEKTLLIVTADHGESLGEQRYWFEHGAYAYQSTCRVPLLVRWPAALEGPERRAGRVREPVALVDLAPTLLAALELGDALGLDAAGDSGPVGRSFLGLLDGEPRSPLVYLEKVERADLEGAVQIKAVRVGAWKLVRRYAHATRAGERELVLLSDELYDLARDPLEEQDLAGAPPAGAPLAELEAELLRFTAADRDFPEVARILARQRAALEQDDPAALRALEALGY